MSVEVILKEGMCLVEVNAFEREDIGLGYWDWDDGEGDV
jgi:hypothetical protein